MLPRISIVSQPEAQRRLLEEPEDYDYVVSLGPSQAKYKPPKGFDEFPGQKLRVEFDDIVFASPTMLQMGYIPPSRDDVKQILEFVKKIDGPSLFHCQAGISRSSASALIHIADKLGPGEEVAAVNYLKQLEDKSEDIFPNELILFYADELMERRGALTDAFREYFLYMTE